MPEVPARYRPYRTADDRIVLANSVVLSLDLLGTRAFAEEDAQRNLEITHGALRRANQWGDGGKSSGTIVRWFSDNVALADPIPRAVSDGDPPDLTLGFHLITAGWMQLELAMMGFFT